MPGDNFVKVNSLVDINKVLLPPLHVKLGQIKKFVKDVDKYSAALQNLRTLFLRSAKINEGIFVRPYFRDILKDKLFEKILTINEH